MSVSIPAVPPAAQGEDFARLAAAKADALLAGIEAEEAERAARAARRRASQACQRYLRSVEEFAGQLTLFGADGKGRP